MSRGVCFVLNPPLFIFACVPLPSEFLCLAPSGAEGVLQAAVRPPLTGTVLRSAAQEFKSLA